MSAQAKAASRPHPAASVVARTPRSSSRLSAVLGCGLLMLATLMAVLLLNIALSRGSYTSERLSARQTLLSEQEQQLSEQLDASRAPGVLDARARAIGMVPDEHPGYLRLSDGAVLGDPSRATTPAPEPTPSGAAPASGGEPAVDTDGSVDTGAAATPTRAALTPTASTASPSASGGD